MSNKLNTRIRLEFDPKQLQPTPDELSRIGRLIATEIVHTIVSRTQRGVFLTSRQSQQPYNREYAIRKAKYLGTAPSRHPVNLTLKKTGDNLLRSLYGATRRFQNGVTAYAALRDKPHVNPFNKKSGMTTRRLADIIENQGVGKSRIRRQFRYITQDEADRILNDALAGRLNNKRKRQ